MTEHYTQNTESVTAWCNTCCRNTVHSVSGGRRGRCTEHESVVRAKIPKFEPPEEKQKKLFE